MIIEWCRSFSIGAKLPAASLCSLLLFSAHENSSAQSLLVADKYGVSESLSRGDSVRLDQLSREHTDPLVRLYSRAAYLRTTFDLPAAEIVARGCFQDAASQQRPEQATMCALLELQSMFDAGKLAEWKSRRILVRDQLNRIFRSKYGRESSIRYLESFGDLASPNVGNPRLNWIGEAFSPFGNSNEWKISEHDTKSMLIEARIDDARQWVLLDTGSHTSLISNNMEEKTTSMDSKKTVVPKFKHFKHIDLLGGRIENFFASHPQNKNIPTILGLDILSKFPTITFTNDGVRASDKHDSAQCTSPLIIISDINSGAYKIKIPMKVDDVDSLAFMDTGSDSYVTRIGGPTPSSGAKRKEQFVTELGIDTREYWTATGKIEFGRAGKPVERDIQVTPDGTTVYGYRVGRRALRDIDVTIDFKNRHLCVTAAGSRPG